MTRPNRMIAAAPAKVNLGLEVVRRRPDGYHELVTLMQAISLFDRFEWTATDQPFVYEGPASVPVAGDLVARVLDSAPDRANWTGRLRVIKQIPLAAGLGGGSSDAALALRLAYPDAPESDLRARAATLGSDVPFFLKGGTALAIGTGTALTWQDTTAHWFVLVTPPLVIKRKTPALYGGLQPADFSDGNLVRSLVASRSTSAHGIPNAFLRQLLGYDMVRYAYDALGRVGGAAAAVSVSGAGPTVYALTDTWRDANFIAERLPRDVGAVHIARSLSADGSHATLTRMARALRGT